MLNIDYSFIERAENGIESSGKFAYEKQEITELHCEHKTLRAQMEFIIETLKNVSERSSSTSNKIVLISDLLRFYFWPLYDFKEAINRHFAFDERLFIFLGYSIGEIVREHQAINREMDNIIHLAENAVYHKSSQGELERASFNITKMFKKLCDSIESHATKEDTLLK